MKNILIWFVLELFLMYGDINLLYCELFVMDYIEYQEVYEIEDDDEEDNVDGNDFPYGFIVY